MKLLYIHIILTDEDDSVIYARAGDGGDNFVMNGSNGEVGGDNDAADDGNDETGGGSDEADGDNDAVDSWTGVAADDRTSDAADCGAGDVADDRTGDAADCGTGVVANGVTSDCVDVDGGGEVDVIYRSNSLTSTCTPLSAVCFSTVDFGGDVCVSA